MTQPWDGIAESIIETVKSRAKKLWDENLEMRTFVGERAKTLAEIVWKYKTTSDEAKRAELHHEMQIVQQTIENSLTAIALVAAAEAQATFREVVNTAFGTLIRALPAVLAAL